jgi:HNH endonuclease/NUMOD3 motif
MHEYVCEECGIKFRNPPSDKSRFCNRKCKSKFLSKKFSGIGNPFYGKRHPEEFKKRISERNKAWLGDKAPNWKGGEVVIESVSRARDRRNRMMANADGFHLKEDWEFLKFTLGNKCLRCGKPENEVSLQKDHIVPISRGGTHWLDNLQPLCKRCNCQKHARTMDLRPTPHYIF